MERDLEVTQKEQKTQTSTVLMIDVIFDNSVRRRPHHACQKVALALVELIKDQSTPKTRSTLWCSAMTPTDSDKDLPYLEIGPLPYYNAMAGLRTGDGFTASAKEQEQVIFHMITDGKPTCLKEGHQVLQKTRSGLDHAKSLANLTLAAQARRLQIPVDGSQLPRPAITLKRLCRRGLRGQ
jgi:uncharacterized protein with von Willebrand factor type A (vWA) domain